MKSLVTVLVLIMTGSAVLFAEEPKKIQDNSFLIEEAYNQEPGVVQHIQTFQYMKDKTWSYSFTEEWPVPKRLHQLSVTLPVMHGADLESGTGLGDVLLNYRYQFTYKEKEGIAFSPRFSLLLPTGKYKKGFGKGGFGMQVNLPLSVELSDKWVTHWNLGTTYVPKGKGPMGGKANSFGYNYGMSLIFLATENINLMIETAGNSTETVKGDGKILRNNSFFVNPGVRFAINFESGLQIVPGIAFPIGIGPSLGEKGVFLYLSFEHQLF